MGKQKIKSTFNVSFNSSNEERFMLLILNGLVEDAKHLPRKSQLLKIALEDFLKNQNITIPDNFNEKYEHYFNDNKKDKIIIEKPIKEEVKIVEPVETIQETKIVDDDVDCDVTILDMEK